MDNRLFNINGKDKEMLGDTLRLAFLQNGNNTKAVSWKEDLQYGLILCWYCPENDNTYHKFPTGLPADKVLDIVWAWLEEVDISKMILKSWEKDADHDGDNKRGWRVYVEDWGHIGSISNAICAIKPIYLWYGK